MKADFVFSKNDVDHFLLDDTNKKNVLKFKEETGGKAIREFIGLKPKLYSAVLNSKKKSNLGHLSTPISIFLQNKMTTTTTNIPHSLNLLQKTKEF